MGHRHTLNIDCDDSRQPSTNSIHGFAKISTFIALLNIVYDQGSIFNSSIGIVLQIFVITRWLSCKSIIFLFIKYTWYATNKKLNWKLRRIKKLQVWDLQGVAFPVLRESTLMFVSSNYGSRYSWKSDSILSITILQ